MSADGQRKEYLQRMADLLKKELPDGYGFILLAAPVHVPEGGRVLYTSDLRREDAITLLKTWMIYSSGEEDWMKHIR